MAEKRIKNPHVGEILKKDFLEALNISQNALAKALSIPANRIYAIVKGDRAITADTDLRLCKFFKLTDGYFLRMQIAYDLLEAKRFLNNELSAISPLTNQSQRIKK